MSGWHSLSGHLQYKSGNNALGRLITRRKVWCVLEESECRLDYYRSEEDFHRRRPAHGSIELSGAAINLDLQQHNQFVLLSDGKEHIFTAENHESMMIWLLGLQAKRDLHSHKNNSNAVSKDANGCHGDRSNTTNGDDLDPCGGRPNLFMSPELTRGLHGVGRNPGPYCGQQSESFDSGMPFYKRGLEASKSFPEHSDYDRPHLHRTKALSHSHAMLSQDNSDSDEVFGSDVQPGSPRRSGSGSGSGTPSQWQRIRAAMLGGNRARSASNSNSNSIGESSISAAGGSRSESQPARGSVGNESMEGNSVSSRSVSSDSAIERGEGTPHELSARLTELERELISTKCELAKVLNRQTSYREILVQKDDTIRQLEEQSGNSSDSSEGRKKRKEKKNVRMDEAFQEKVRVLQNQNRFLNEEVRKLAKIRLKEHGQFQEQNAQLSDLEGEIERWKMDYVCLIQSSIRHPGGETGTDDLELCLYGGDKHKRRVQALLEEARKTNPRLPTYESLSNHEVHVDVYGFKHTYTDTGLLLHYLCTELTHHYLVQAGAYEEHQRRWTMFMRLHGKDPLKNWRELKTLCRGGIPDRFRRQVWRHLVQHEVKEIVKIKGDYYYRNLCNMLPESPLAACYRKQISLDLMRTMPNNVKFSTQGSKGIMDLQDVLLAFCVHNPAVGYCQGMNFIVGMALIFMEAEDAFWTLVAIAERYFSPHYFDHSLIGAQADQQVLKDMVKEQLPALYEHLDGIDIELSTITLNWFLAVFFDAVPFQTLLRVWDCFLLEGPKVLFRFSLAILKIHEKDILQKTDTMGIMKHLKACAKLSYDVDGIVQIHEKDILQKTDAMGIMKHLKACAKLSYDVDGIVQLAFNGMKPFPKRREIYGKAANYLSILKEKHKKKEMQRLAFAEREQLYMNMEAEAGTFMGIECAVAMSEGDAWFCYGDQHIGRLCHVSCKECSMANSEFSLDSRLMCMCCMSADRLVLGTISWRLVAVDSVRHAQMWQIQLHDAILSVCCYDDEEAAATRIFAGLADGTVAVTEKECDQAEPSMDVMYIPIGQAPVTCLMLLGEQVWSASGNTVAVIHAKTLDTMDTFSVSVNPYDHILSLVPSEFGIWVSLRGSSILELWDPKTLNCKMLYDTRTDRYPQLRKEDDSYFNHARITSTLVHDSRVWIGTGEGNLIIYEIVESAMLKTPTDNCSSVETNSTLSYITRPSKTKVSDLTIPLPGVGDMKRDSGNISGDSLEVHHDEDDDKMSDCSAEYLPRRNKPRRKSGCVRNLQPVADMFAAITTVRRSSSETDMGVLQASRYANDGLSLEGADAAYNNDDQTLLSVKQMPKKICSENDLKKLGVERFSVESENYADCESEEAEEEMEAEAEARRLSLTILIDAEGDDMDLSSRINSRRKSDADHKPTRKMSTERGPRRISLTSTQNKDNYKSDDSGCETFSGKRKCKIGGKSARRPSQANREAIFLSSGCDVDENVLEAEQEQRARKERFLHQDSSEYIPNESDEHTRTNKAQHRRLKHLMALHQNSSVYSDSSASLDLDNAGIQTMRRKLNRDFSDDAMQYLSTFAMDDNYLSSSPSLSITPSPSPKPKYFSSVTIEGPSVEMKGEGTAITRSKSDQFLFGNPASQYILEERRRTRRLSVIEDMSVICSDCKLLKQKCSDCKLLLTGQELLKINERRKSLMDPACNDKIRKGITRPLGQKQIGNNDLSKNTDMCSPAPRHLPPTSASCLEVFKGIDDGEKSCNSKLSVDLCKDPVVPVVYTSSTGLEANASDSGISKGVTEQEHSISRVKKPFRERLSQSIDSSHSTADLESTQGDHNAKQKKERRSSLQEKYAKLFPVERERKHMSRKEKVGNWLSSIATTDEFSIDKDDIIIQGRQALLIEGTEQIPGKPCQDEEDVPSDAKHCNMVDAVSGRPKSLSLGWTTGRARLREYEGTSVGSDGSCGTRHSMTTNPDLTVDRHDPGTQYRLDFTNVHVADADKEQSLPSPFDERSSTNNEQSNLEWSSSKRQTQKLSDSNKGTELLTSEQCNRAGSQDTELPCTKSERGAKEEPEVRITERQRMFEFLKTPSLATRHMSLGLKIIEDDLEWTELQGGVCATPSPTSSMDQRFADFLRTPSISSKPSSLWSSYENISTPVSPSPTTHNEPSTEPAKLILPGFNSRGRLSHSASSASIGSDNDLIYNVDLSLEAKVKISDKPVKCLLATSCKNEPVILSFSGSHGDDEAVLKWTKHQNEDLWTNEPVMEICTKTKQAILPTYMRRRMSSNSSYSSANSDRTRNKH